MKIREINVPFLSKIMKKKYIKFKIEIKVNTVKLPLLARSDAIETNETANVPQLKCLGWSNNVQVNDQRHHAEFPVRSGHQKNSRRGGG